MNREVLSSSARLRAAVCLLSWFAIGAIMVLVACRLAQSDSEHHLDNHLRSFAEQRSRCWP